MRRSTAFAAGACIVFLLGATVALKGTLGKLVFADGAYTPVAMGEFAVSPVDGAARTFEGGAAKVLATTALVATTQAEVDATEIVANAALPKAGGAMTGTTNALRLHNVTTAQRDLIASPAAGMIVWNISTSAFDQYDGAAWEEVAGDTTGLTGTTQPTFTVNDDAIAGDAIAFTEYCQNQGDGGTEIGQACVGYIPGAVAADDTMYLYTPADGLTPGTADDNTVVTVGPAVLSAFAADATLNLRAQTAGGLEKLTSIVTTSAGTTTFTGAGATTYQSGGAAAVTLSAAGSSGFTVTAPAGTGVITVGDTSTLTFKHSSTTGIVLDHGTVDELDMNAYGIRQDDAATHCWGTGAPSGIDGCISYSAADSWLFSHATANGDIAMRLAGTGAGEMWCVGGSAMATDCTSATGITVDGTLRATVAAELLRAVRTEADTTDTQVASDAIVLFDPTLTQTYTLLDASTQIGNELRLIQTDLVLATTVTAASGDTINGSATYSLNTTGEAVTIVAISAAGWNVMSATGSP